MATLAEDLLLLAFDEERPALPAWWRSRLRAALVAALLGELSLRGRLSISVATVRVLDGTPTGDDLLDALLMPVAGTRELWDALEWLLLLRDRIPDLEERLAERLLESESLARTEAGLVATRQLPLPPDLEAIDNRRAKGEPVTPLEQAGLVAHFQRRRRGLLVQRLRAILLKGDACDEHFRLLISLARVTKLLQRLYGRAELKQMQHSVRTLTASEPLGTAVPRTRWAKVTNSVPGVVEKSPPWARY